MRPQKAQRTGVWLTATLALGCLVYLYDKRLSSENKAQEKNTDLKNWLGTASPPVPGGPVLSW